MELTPRKNVTILNTKRQKNIRLQVKNVTIQVTEKQKNITLQAKKTLNNIQPRPEGLSGGKIQEGEKPWERGYM